MFSKLFIIFILFCTLINANIIGPKNFENIIKTHKLVLVKFWAPWCSACKMIKPEFEKAQIIAGKSVYFATYNVDLRGNPIKKYNIETIPTMILFENGKEVDRNYILNAKDIIEWVMGYVPQ